MTGDNTMTEGQCLGKRVVDDIKGWKNRALESPGGKQMVLSKGRMKRPLDNV